MFRTTNNFQTIQNQGVNKETVITYSENIMKALEEYIGVRQGTAFITRTGKSVPRLQLASTFAKAGKNANISFRVTSHTLRSSNVTFLKQQGFGDSEIMKVTGHASAEMIYAYNKIDMAKNASKRIYLTL